MHFNVKHNKRFQLFLVAFLCLLNCVASTVIPSAEEEEVKEVVISSVDFACPGDTCQITVTSYNWDKIAAGGGGYDFRILLPAVLEVKGVYLNGSKLSSDVNSDCDYFLRENNEIRFNNYFGGGNEESFTVLQYAILANVKADAVPGKYKISFLEESVIANEDEQVIPVVFTDGSLVVPSREDCLKGDLNSDGCVLGGDLVLLRKELLGINAAEIAEASADVNADGKMDVQDLVALKKYFVCTSDRVYLSENGDDRNTGGENAPVKSFNRALELVSCAGTIEIVGDYALKNDFCWNHHSKSVTVTGGSLDMSLFDSIRIGDAVTLDDINVALKSNAVLYACGYPFTVGAGASVNGTSTVYGGSTRKVKHTQLTLLSGTYNKIYGGGYNADVTGSTDLHIGGNVNSAVSDITAHNKAYYVFGGSNGGTVTETNLEFTDNATATMIFGGGSGSRSYAGKTNVTVSGGKLMGIYGGSNTGTCGETNLTMTGGEVEQVFGGNESNSMTGNTFVNILGGRVIRRIFGGCYNECDLLSSKPWLSNHHVTGTTTVTIGENANITLDYQETWVDQGISATSRHTTAFDDENAVMVFVNANAKSKYYSKTGITAYSSIVDNAAKWAPPYDSWYVLK